MAVAWAVAWRTGRSGIIDAVWSLATGMAGALAALAPGGLAARRGLVAATGAAWGLRLGLHLWRRAGHGDDPRYAALKAEWGDAAAVKLFRFLQVQALSAWPLVLAFWLAAHAPRTALGWQDAAGVAVVLLALAGEAVADRQVARFRTDPAHRGQVCDRGLWGWSRHPNYFCEWLVWWAVVLIAAGWPWGWLALLAPAWIYVLLVHVSGIPPLEAHMARSRPEAWAAYRARVSAFWPRLPVRR
ncbi:MAG: DUF1295 domain-containing protein [Sphingomonadales bacterium]|nr:DUF1295 domain-containing protein [Sphingomonadales bacterium]